MPLISCSLPQPVTPAKQGIFAAFLRLCQCKQCWSWLDQCPRSSKEFPACLKKTSLHVLAVPRHRCAQLNIATSIGLYVEMSELAKVRQLLDSVQHRGEVGVGSGGFTSTCCPPVSAIPGCWRAMQSCPKISKGPRLPWKTQVMLAHGVIF